MINWKIIDSGVGNAEKNMELDAQLLDSLGDAENPILHFYEWEAPSATYGHFLDPSKHLNMDVATQIGLQLAKRPTGGGIIFHVTDFAFSLLMPAWHPNFSQNTLENYAFVNGLVTQAISTMAGPSMPQLLPKEGLSHPSPSFCMANPTVFDVMIDGKKVGGAAQRRTRHGYLHQGSIFLAMPEDSFLESLLLDKNVHSGMKANSHPLLGPAPTAPQIQSAKQFLKKSLTMQMHS